MLKHMIRKDWSITLNGSFYLIVYPNIDGNWNESKLDMK